MYKMQLQKQNMFKGWCGQQRQITSQVLGPKTRWYLRARFSHVVCYVHLLSRVTGRRPRNRRDFGWHGAGVGMTVDLCQSQKSILTIHKLSPILVKVQFFAAFTIW